MASSKRSSINVVTGLTVVVIVAFVAVVALVLVKSSNKKVTHSADMNMTHPDHSSPETDQYIGLTEEQALAKAEAAHVPARIVSRDGTEYPMTMDFSEGRLSFWIEAGKVTKATVEKQGQ